MTKTKPRLIVGAEYETKDGMRVRLLGPLYRDSLGDRISLVPGAKEVRAWCIVVGKNGPFRVPREQLRPLNQLLVK